MVDQIRFFAGAARVLEGKSAGEYMAGHTSYVRREPIGVIGQVTPWNYPMMMAVWKFAPAIAAGNTVVLKPSDTTPETTLLLAEIAAEFLPSGVLNVVTGDRDTGRAVIEHPTAAMVSITGSIRAGMEVAGSAAKDLKRVHLELGGKAPVIVFDDADLEAAAEAIAIAGYFNAGQDCTAATRVLAAPGIHDDFVSALTEQARSAKVGAPDDDDALLGPVNNPDQMARVTGFLDRLPDHASLQVGGDRVTELGDGYFLRPAVVSGLRQDDEATQDEIFGPVITVQRFDDEARGAALGQRRPVRPGLERLDPGRRPRDADEPTAGLRLRVGELPHPARRRDAPRRLQTFRVRQGPLDVRSRGLHPDQARDDQDRVMQMGDGRTAIVAERLFDGELVIDGGVAVLVEDGRILGVERPDAVPDGWPVQSRPNATIMPGLIDAHVHLCADNTPEALDKLPDLDDDALDAIIRRSLEQHRDVGVTTVRDLGTGRTRCSTGGDRGRLMIAEGLPAVLASGPPLTTPRGHCWNMGGEVAGVDAVRSAVRQRAERGADVIKIMASGGIATQGTDVYACQFADEEFAAAVDEAHALGLPITAHAHALVAAEQAVRLGVDGIEHFTCATPTGVAIDDAFVRTRGRGRRDDRPDARGRSRRRPAAASARDARADGAHARGADADGRRAPRGRSPDRVGERRRHRPRQAARHPADRDHPPRRRWRAADRGPRLGHLGLRRAPRPPPQGPHPPRLRR